MPVSRVWNGSAWEDIGAAVPGVTLDTAQTITGLKTFSVAPVVPDGAFGVAKISATGTREATTFLRGDGTWAAIPAAPVLSVNGRIGAVTGLAESDAVVNLTTAQTVAGVKTFTSAPVVPDSSFALSKIAATGTRDATTYLRGDGTWSPIAGSAPANMVTTDTSQTIAGSKTFTAVSIFEGGLLNRGAAATTVVQGIRITGDVANRLAVQANGTLLFGDGTNALDVTLYRSGGNLLATNGIFAATQIIDNGSRVYSVSNKVPVAGISATGTPGATTYLRGDGTWATVASGAPANMVTTDTSQTISANKTLDNGSSPASDGETAVSPYLVFTSRHNNGGVVDPFSTYVYGTSAVVPGLYSLSGRTAVASVAGAVQASAFMENEDRLFTNIEPLTFAVTGTLSVQTGKSRIYLEHDYVVESIRPSVNTAPVGAPIIVDINVNGSSLTASGDRATIPAGSFTSTMQHAAVGFPIMAGSYITVDVDAVGTTTAGSDLTVHIRLRRVS